MSDRDRKGRFTVRNQICYQGWRALVDQRFAGEEHASRAWWGRIGAWYYDTPYRNSGHGAIAHPGTPEEFLQRWRACYTSTTLSIKGR